MGGPLFDESGRYVGDQDDGAGPQTLFGQLKESIAWSLVGWALFIGLVLCFLGALWLFGSD